MVEYKEKKIAQVKKDNEEYCEKEEAKRCTDNKKKDNESDEEVESSSEVSSISEEDTSTTDMDNDDDSAGEELTDGEDFSNNDDADVDETTSNSSDDDEEITESADSQQEEENNLYSTDIMQISEEIRKADTNSKNYICETKYELLVLYLVNLSLYKKLTNPQEHPVYEILLKISEMLKQTIKLEKETSLNNKKQEKREIRHLTKNMKNNLSENLLYVKSGETPREKHKRKAEELESQKQAKVDGNIEMMVTKTSKFK